ncbi:MAG: Rpn family recombination-promoting nuclease/putative transposase [Planctomycetes bacterium]|nr:Rpn family recombination-promoting nuclease/putative transposase [Planctomycetota bacterium]
MHVERRNFLTQHLLEKTHDVVVSLPYLGAGAEGAEGAPGRGADKVLVYLLAENESQKKPLVALRLLLAMGLLWESERAEQEQAGVGPAEVCLPTIVSLVFYTGERPWNGVRTLRELVRAPAKLLGFVPQHDVLFVNLAEVEESALERAADPYFGSVLLVLQRRHARGEEFHALLPRVARGMEGLRGQHEPRWRRLMLSLLRITTHYRERAELGILVEEIASSVEDAERRAEVRTMGMTAAQAFRAEGRAEARPEVMAETLVRQLGRKFGPLPPGLAERVATLRDEAKLEALLDRILTAARLEEMGLGE